MDEFLSEALNRYPEEACGFFVGAEREGLRAAEGFIACRNVQNDLHAADPGRYPRTAATAYAVDPEDWRRAEAAARDKNLSIIAVAHSHPDHGAYFSEEDRANAAPWGEPLFPGVSYVVASVNGGEVAEVNEFLWDDGEKDFRRVKTDIPLTRPSGPPSPGGGGKNSKQKGT